ncbi:MAG: hypothetical protein V3U71_02935 [Cocleimonas sp.]
MFLNKIKINGQRENEMPISNDTNKLEVYTTTGFRDLLESPMFYAVLLITFILGSFSILGFLQNPLKLQTAVDRVNHQISVSTYSPHNIKINSPYILPIKKTNSPEKSQILSLKNLTNTTQQPRSSYQRISFDYDITSKQFWHKLDTSKIDSNADNKNIIIDDSFLGAPLESDYFIQLDSFQYTLKESTVLKI